MRRRRNPAFARAFSTAVLAALALAACGSGPIVSRHKLTLYLTTPEGPLVSSGVSETTIELNDGIAKGWGSSFQLRVDAEAQVIDLGSRGKLFLLPAEADETRRGSDAPPSGIFAELHRDVSGGVVNAEGERRLAALADVTEAPLVMLPLLVRFRDINVPTSVENVDPRDLTKSFGPGVRMDRATIQVTSEPVTRGVVEAAMPPWFANLARQNASLDGDTSRLRRSDAPLSNRLNIKSFVDHSR